jgi:hypothetical protein
MAEPADGAATVEPAGEQQEGEQPADLVSPLSDVGAVWAPHRTQSELEAAERVVQDGLVAAAQRQHEPRETTLLCAPGRARRGAMRCDAMQYVSPLALGP